MGISVEIDNLSNIPYSEYVLTGFYLLKEKRVIDQFKIKLNNIIKPVLFNQQTQLVRSILRQKRVNETLGWDHITGTIKDNGNTKKFAINILDTPWNFGEQHFLDESDIYFKCQYPHDFKKGYMHLTSRVNIPISKEVMENAQKVRPLMLGRPLSRALNFKTNIKLLKKFEEKRKNLYRKYSVLVYFGMAYDNLDIKNTHHPHLKRADLLTYVSKNIPKSKIIFNPPTQELFQKQLKPEILMLSSSGKVSDKTYINLIQNSFSTLNITGLRGSVPWRVIDSFLSGMVLISDNFYVDWYEPLIGGKDFMELGDLGYNLLSDIDLPRACEKLKLYAENIENTSKDTADYREQRFNQFYSPQAVASYLLRESGFL